MSLVKFHNFYFRYKGNEIYALNDIKLSIEEERFILLAGETGSGKTSLIRCMNGLIPQFYTGHYKGMVEVKGRETTSTPIAALSSEVGVVFQNPENQLITMNVEHELAFGLENLGISPKLIKERIQEVVELTEIKNLLSKAPFELSGGEQQRVAIASILILEPKLIILDEPTASLDPLYAQKIIKLLKKIQEEKKVTIIISEHRLDLLISLVDEIILMKEGRILIHDSTEKVLESEVFDNLNINKPVIYSIFKQLDSNQKSIPVSLEQALKRCAQKNGK
ncbi:MAG: energy-coupling factor ABC transporter ATP-binding protein [Promethearchaeota archaeon]